MNSYAVHERPKHQVLRHFSMNGAHKIPAPHRLLVFLFAGSIGLGVLGLPSARAQSGSQPEMNAVEKDRALIESVLKDQVNAWNEGDLVKFMDTYWKSDKLTFSSGGQTTSGWQATLDNYKKNYAPPNQMGQLHFDELAISMIESKSALVLGNWHLKMKDGEKRDGNFSLVVKKLESGWKIIHDHSSSLDPVKKPDAD